MGNVNGDLLIANTKLRSNGDPQFVKKPIYLHPAGLITGFGIFDGISGGNSALSWYEMSQASVRLWPFFHSF